MRIARIGIALAAYRPEPRSFAEQLESIRAQTWEDWICHVTFDSSAEEARRDEAVARQLEDPRFRVSENRERLGHKSNFERAIGLVASGGVDAIACADQDDRWYPRKLERSAARLAELGPFALVHCDMHVLEGEGTLPRTAWQIERRGIRNTGPQHLLVRNVVAGAALLMDANLARRFPRIPPGAEYHDHWYALAASTLGGVYPIDEPLFAYRQHAGNVVGVSPYHGLFWVPSGVGPAAILTKCRGGFRKSRALARDAVAQGIEIGGLARALFLSEGEPSLGALALSGLGLSHLVDDRPLARACLARSFGRFLEGYAPRAP